jgi:MFS family permease
LQTVEAAVDQPVTVGYLGVLRESPAFRRLWIGQLISNAGDWFNNIAVLGLVMGLTGSPAAIAWLIIAQQLPSFLMTPVAGAVVDRFDRRQVMIAADLIRSVLALGFLLIRRPHQVWLAYVLGAGLMAVSAFFQPAHSAAVPNLVRREALISANGLASSTWASMLAVGAAAGGLVSAYLGRDVAFGINAFSFVVSALLIASIRVPFHEMRDGQPVSISGRVWEEFRAALRYVRAHPEVWTLLPVKAGWGLGGGVILLLTVFGTQVFGAGDAGIGWLYAARGLGALLGPYLVRFVVGNDFWRMRRAILAAFLLVGASYTLFSAMPSLAFALPMVIMGHMGGGTAWVLSTTMLQQLVPDRLRGRVFALDSGLAFLTMPLSTLAVGMAAERFDPRLVARGTASVFFVTAALYGLLLVVSRVSAQHKGTDDAN